VAKKKVKKPAKPLKKSAPRRSPQRRPLSSSSSRRSRRLKRRSSRPKAIAGKAPAPAAVAAAPKGGAPKAVVPAHKPTTAGEIAAKIAGKRAADAASKKGRNGRHAEIAPRVLTPADVEARKRRLKTLIVLGKERGFLTFAEINDHLPTTCSTPSRSKASSA
jgi:RNA polymerase primary sigma factor